MEQNDQPHVAPQGKKVLLGATVVFVVAAIGIAFWWFIWGQFTETTEDAYVNGNQVQLISRIPGTVTSIFVDDTQLVEEGQLLVVLDPVDRQNAFAMTKANLAETVRSVAQLFDQVPILEAQLHVREAALAMALVDYDNRKGVVASGGVSKEDFIHSEITVRSAEASVEDLMAQLKSASDQVAGLVIANHPLVQQSAEAVREAWLKLKRCELRASATGVIAQRSVQVGQRINVEEPLLAIVPMDQMWVNANFKEIQLKNIRIGQPARVTSDLYGGGVVFNGTVVGIGGGTGAVFSVLPPQNATGNWIKIVQRLPVRISIPLEELKDKPLRLGLSTEVKIDTHNRSGRVIPKVAPVEPLFSTGIFKSEEEGVEEVIEKIIVDNAV